MNTEWLWSGAAGLVGLCLTAATPNGGGCGGHGGCSDHCSGSGAGGGATTGSGGSGPASPSLTILATTSSGDGCPGASAVQAWYDADAQALVLTYPPFSIAKSSPGFDHSSCATGLTVKGVPGWQFAATGVSLHGRADLPAGAKVRVETNVFFAGLPATSERDVELQGPRSGAFDDMGGLAGQSLWSPCGADAIFNTQVGQSVQTSTSDPASSDLSTVTLLLTWRAC